MNNYRCLLFQGSFWHLGLRSHHFQIPQETCFYMFYLHLQSLQFLLHFFFFFFLQTSLEKLLVCSAVPSSYHLIFLILIAKLLKQVDSMCCLTFVSHSLPVASDILAAPLPFHRGSVVFCLPDTLDRLSSGYLSAILTAPSLKHWLHAQSLPTTFSSLLFFFFFCIFIFFLLF